MNGAGLQGFILRKRRQNRGQTAGQHALAAARTATHQQVMATSRRNFHGAAGVRLPLHFVEIHRGGQRGPLFRQGERRKLSRIQQHIPGFAQRFHGIHGQPLHHGSLSSILRRHHHKCAPGIARRHGQRQHATHPAHHAIQRQLTHQTPGFQPGGNAALERLRHIAVIFLDSHLQRQGNGQIEARPLFTHICRRQIHRNLHISRAEKRTICQCRGHTLHAFAHGGIRQPHHGHTPDVLHRAGIHLHLNFITANSLHRGRMQTRNHLTSL